MEIQPQLFKLDSFMHGRLFRVPQSQRAYAWGKKQRDDLFGDIKRVKQSDEDHFLATIVLSRKSEKKKIIADQFSVIEIVDGQQRLTTLIILLRSIQNFLDSNNREREAVSGRVGAIVCSRQRSSRIFAKDIPKAIRRNDFGLSRLTRQALGLIIPMRLFVTANELVE